MVWCAGYAHQRSYKRSRAGDRYSGTNPYHRGLHRGEAECQQHCVLAASVGVHIMQQIGSEGSRQRCCHHRNDREEGQRLRKVVHLPAKLTVAFGDEHSWLKAEGFPQPVHHRQDILCRGSDDESVGQC